MTFNPQLGVKNPRSPGSIVNIQANKPTASQRGLECSPAAIREILSASTTLTPVDNFGLIRVFNTNAGVQYLWVGLEGDEPETVDITNGLALAIGVPENFVLPASSDASKSLCIKTSSDDVQVAIMES